MTVGVGSLGGLTARELEPGLLGVDGYLEVARERDADLAVALRFPACVSERFFGLVDRHAADLDAVQHHVRVDNGGLADNDCADECKRCD